MFRLLSLCAILLLSSCGYAFLVGGVPSSDHAVVTSSIPYTSVPTDPPPSFGHAMRSLFALAPTYLNFNSGSFGGAPRMVLQQRAAWSTLCEERPDPWYRGGYQAQARQVRATWAAYVNANESDLVLVENTSAGINSVLRSFPFQARDTILMLDLAYDMVQNTVSYIQQRYDLQVVVADTEFPVVDDTSFTKPVADLIAATPAIRMCIFSHITSVPSVIIPIAKLAEQCKAIGAIVLIDGAHAVGQISVDLTSLSASGVSFYVANGHKWLYGAHGTAMLWARPQYQSESYLVPATLSSTTSFIAEYEFTGTRDYTAFASLNATFNFRSWIGDAAIMNYIKSIADQGAEYLVGLFGTDYAVPLAMSHALTNIGLPTTNYTLASGLTSAMLAEYDMYLIPFEHPPKSNVFWMRFSNQIYIDMSDYHNVGRVVLQYLNIQPATGGPASRWKKQRAALRQHAEAKRMARERKTRQDAAGAIELE